MADVAAPEQRGFWQRGFGRRSFWQRTGAMAPASLLVLVFLALPMLLMLRFSFNRFIPGQFMVEATTPENYLKLATDPYYRHVLALTLTVSVSVTLLALVIGWPVAQFLARTQSRHKGLMLLAVVLPLFVGNAVRAAGWMVAFGREGLVNGLLQALGLIDAPLDIMFTPTAVIIGIVSVNLSYVVLTLSSVIEGIDRRAEEAALSLGATPFETWRLVTLPMALPGLLAAGVLSFILSMNAYATPVLLGGPSFQMMAPVVADQVLQRANWPFGASLGFVLMLVTLSLTASMNWLVGRRYGR
ncbi:ABC transporter permease [Aliidongia dinghuensis]|uniref:ABC transporter permease n=1 Tax=Aliidongia dinghuensis TaxID=1867774 RepID=A0A8J2YTG9_9PROT|nr:ABC transporter permease [Aliidongia dinghuensis]GGF14135.1 ABC transporter permease [Aliidongia dinghuensis]